MQDISVQLWKLYAQICTNTLYNILYQEKFLEISVSKIPANTSHELTKTVSDMWRASSEQMNECKITIAMPKAIILEQWKRKEDWMYLDSTVHLTSGPHSLHFRLKCKSPERASGESTLSDNILILTSSLKDA